MKPNLAVLSATVVLALAGCSPDLDSSFESTATETLVSTPSPSPTTPASSVGQLVAVPLTVAEDTNPGSAQGQSLKLPQGWTAEVWANVPGGRIAAWDPNGSLLVSHGKGGTVTRLTPTEPGKAPKQEAIITGLNNPQGLGFALNGKFLVMGEGDKIVRYDYTTGTPQDPTTLVGDLPTSGHGSKGIAISGDIVYYSLGSADGCAADGRGGDSQRATCTVDA
jgi:glucose/arabinose dehydrogenase